MVGIEVGDGGQARTHGTVTCGSVWSCPRCAQVIRAERADELQRASERWHETEGHRLAMVSLTVRHEWTDRLADLAPALADSWRRLVRGRPWRRFLETYAVEGYTRAVEVTCGANGWHPHVHALLWLRADLDADETRDAQAWLARRWRSCVERTFGMENSPTLERGCVLRVGSVARYLSKIGLEIAGATTKGRDAFSLLESGTDECVRKWKEYAAAMHGRRHLTWSRGMRDRLGLGEELDDDALVLQPSVEWTLVALTDAPVWDSMCRAVGVSGVLAAASAGELHERIRQVLGARASPHWVDHYGRPRVVWKMAVAGPLRAA